MELSDMKAEFERTCQSYESTMLTFKGVGSFDVYNCSVPFVWKGCSYIYGRVEKRDEWACSRVFLFDKTGHDEFTVSADSGIYQLEDPFIQFIGDEIVMGGTRVFKENGEIKTYHADFFRGTDLNQLVHFASGPDRMKDIRLVQLRDGRIGVFSRPNGKQIEEKYGSGSVVGFTIIEDLHELTAEVIENAEIIGHLFGKGEWGGCNHCYLLRDGRIGVIGHKCYTQKDDEGMDQAVYMNVAFMFDPETRQATEPRIIATRKSYPMYVAKKPRLKDCAFPSGIVLRSDGKVDLYSGIGDTAEGRVVIDNPFQGLLTGAPDR